MGPFFGKENDSSGISLAWCGLCLEQLVPAVTELVIAELLYLQYSDPRQPIYVYINSTGTSRADGETVYHLLHDWYIMTCIDHSYKICGVAMC